jgi:hypothetical protein
MRGPGLCRQAWWSSRFVLDPLDPLDRIDRIDNFIDKLVRDAPGSYALSL